MKTCKTCKISKPESEFHKDSSKIEGISHSCKSCKCSVTKRWHLENPERRREQQNAYYKKNPDKKLELDLRAYGLSLEQWDELMLRQGGVCAICEKPCRSGKRLAVDHIHGTNPVIVRGLLCQCCNRALGLFKDSPTNLNRASRYAERAGEC